MSRIVPLKNGLCGIDYDDILVVPAQYKTIKFGSEDKVKKITIKIAPEKKFVRLVALKDFVAKDKVVKINEKGAYIELKNGRCVFSLGKNSWIEGSFMATEQHPSLVGYNCSIGDNTLVGMCCYIGKNTQIQDNCKIAPTCKIGKNCVINNGVVMRDTIVGDNTYIGENATFGMKKIDGTVAFTGLENFIGTSPNYYKHFWWNLNTNPYNLGREKMTFRDVWERYVKEKYYKSLITYISDNAQIDVGTQIFCGATIGKNAKIGASVKVNPKAFVRAEQIVQDKEIVQ